MSYLGKILLRNRKKKNWQSFWIGAVFFLIALIIIDLFTNNQCSQMKVISVLIFYDLNQFSFTNPINSLINLLQNKGVDRILVSIKTTRIKYFFMRSRNNIQNMQLKLYVYNMYIQFSQRFFFITPNHISLSSYIKM